MNQTVDSLQVECLEGFNGGLKQVKRYQIMFYKN